MSNSTADTSDSHEILSAGEVAPRLRIGYSLAFSLYQTTLAVGLRTGAPTLAEDPRWHRAGKRLQALRLPLGPFNYFEFATTRTETTDQFRTRLAERVHQFHMEFSSTLGELEEAYRLEIWPQHRLLLDDSLNTLIELLAPRRDELFEKMASLLNLGHSPEECEVTLVPVCYVPVGGYSHPTVIDVSSFQGSRLLEATVHELAHVFIADEHDVATSNSYTLLVDAVRARGRSDRDAAELFHALIFQASGRLVRDSGLSDHQPYALEHGIFHRISRRLGVTLSPHAIDRSLSRWLAGDVSIREAIHEIADLLPVRDSVKR